MVSYKLDKYDKYFVAFILVILVIFNIGQCFASETVDIQEVNGIVAPTNGNYFVDQTGGKVGYIQIEKGYVYEFNNISEGNIRLNISSAVPSANVTYELLTNIDSQGNYSYLSNENTYVYISVNSYNQSLNFNDYLTVSRRFADNYNGVVDSLVDNVGVSQLWGVFESGIDFIGVVVLVAFGLFLIVLLIKKLSKGKSDF